jgi:hypothetical protein
VLSGAYYRTNISLRTASRSVLDTLDTAIHETEAIIAKLKAVKQGLLHDLLTRGIAANGELRPPQAEAPHLQGVAAGVDSERGCNRPVIPIGQVAALRIVQLNRTGS